MVFQLISKLNTSARANLLWLASPARAEWVARRQTFAQRCVVWHWFVIAASLLGLADVAWLGRVEGAIGGQTRAHVQGEKVLTSTVNHVLPNLIGAVPHLAWHAGPVSLLTSIDWITFDECFCACVQVQQSQPLDNGPLLPTVIGQGTGNEFGSNGSNLGNDPAASGIGNNSQNLASPASVSAPVNDSGFPSGFRPAVGNSQQGSIQQGSVQQGSIQQGSGQAENNGLPGVNGLSGFGNGAASQPNLNQGLPAVPPPSGQAGAWSGVNPAAAPTSGLRPATPSSGSGFGANGSGFGANGSGVEAAGRGFEAGGRGLPAVNSDSNRRSVLENENPGDHSAGAGNVGATGGLADLDRERRADGNVLPLTKIRNSSESTALDAGAVIGDRAAQSQEAQEAQEALDRSRGLLPGQSSGRLEPIQNQAQNQLSPSQNRESSSGLEPQPRPSDANGDSSRALGNPSSAIGPLAGPNGNQTPAATQPQADWQRQRELELERLRELERQADQRDFANSLNREASRGVDAGSNQAALNENGLARAGQSALKSGAPAPAAENGRLGFPTRTSGRTRPPEVDPTYEPQPMPLGGQTMQGSMNQDSRNQGSMNQGPMNQGSRNQVGANEGNGGLPANFQQADIFRGMASGAERVSRQGASEMQPRGSADVGSNGFRGATDRLRLSQPQVVNGRDGGAYAAGNGFLPSDRGNVVDALGNLQVKQDNIRNWGNSINVPAIPQVRKAYRAPLTQNDFGLPNEMGRGGSVAMTGMSGSNSNVVTPTNTDAGGNVGDGRQSEGVEQKNQSFSDLAYWMLIFSMAANLVMFWFLYESRTRYQQLADEMQDRFFRETS